MERSPMPMTATPNSTPAVVQVGTQTFPVSENQHRALFLETLRPGDPPPVMRTAARLPADLDVERLQAAFVVVCRIQDAFRTHFERTADGFVQHIDAEGGLSMETREFPGDAAQAVDDLIHGKLFGELHPVLRAFGAPPLAHATLLHCADRQYVLAASCHHVICDGTSSPIFLQQLSQLYRSADMQATAQALRSTCVPYREFVDYERRELDGGHGAELVRFWRDYLAPVVPRHAAVAEPAGRAAPRMEAVPIRIGRDQAGALERLARSQRLTLHLALLGCFQLALAACTGQRLIVTATPTKNRPLRFARTVGLFVNPVAVVNTLQPQHSLLESLVALRQSAADAYRHSALPLRRVMQAVLPSVMGGRNPLFNSWFSIQVMTARPEVEALRNFKVVDLPAGRGAVADYCMEMQFDGGELKGTLLADAQLADAGRAAHAFVCILDALLHRPALTVAALLDDLTVSGSAASPPLAGVQT
jgi:hypothetical protein